MATKKKAAKKTIKISAITSVVNWIPFCVQIEHSEASNKDLRLSILGNLAPNSLYFAFQTPPAGAGAGASVTLLNGLRSFVGYVGNPDVTIPVDQYGMTAILTLDPRPGGAAQTNIKWTHKDSRGGANRSGGGIIVDA
jgi:hypothetical protein